MRYLLMSSCVDLMPIKSPMYLPMHQDIIFDTSTNQISTFFHCDPVKYPTSYHSPLYDYLFNKFKPFSISEEEDDKIHDLCISLITDVMIHSSWKRLQCKINDLLRALDSF